MEKFLPQTIMFYSMVDKYGEHPPSDGYLQTIVQGYVDCEISTDPLLVAVKSSLPQGLTIQ